MTCHLSYAHSLCLHSFSHFLAYSRKGGKDGQYRGLNNKTIKQYVSGLHDFYDQEEAHNGSLDAEKQVTVTNPWHLAPGSDKSRTSMSAFMSMSLRRLL
jgi:hypothetical protein